MLRNWEFQIPTQIVFGRGGLRKLGEIAKGLGGSAFLVGYRDRSGMEKTYDRAVKSLGDAGVAVTEFFDIPPDPDAELAAAGAERLKAAGCEVVIGLGGGSVIDAAKGMAVLARIGGNLWDYTGANPDNRPATDSLPVIAIPTTAGTGTETSPVGVFTHYGVGADPELPLKASVGGPALRPKVALVDPSLAVGSPASITAACGADALGHAVEACMSRRANPMSSTLAGQAVSLIVENLPLAVADPDAPAPREPLALAAMLAGAAFGFAGVTMTHSIAQALGGVLHIPHGVGVAIGTPTNLRYNAAECVEQYAALAHFCHLGGDSSQERADRFVQCVLDLLKKIGMPDRIEAPADAPPDLAEQLTRNAFLSTPVPIQLNPRPIDEAAMQRVFEDLLKAV